MSDAASIAVVVLLVGWAVWGVLAWPPLKRALAAGDRTALTAEYRLTIIGEVVLAALAFGAAAWAGFGIVRASQGLAIGSAIGVGALQPPVLAGVGTAIVGGVIGIVVARRSGKAPQLAGDIAALLPETTTERRWFAAVCVCVGVCEELLYRGFMGGWLSDIGLNGVAVLVIGSVFFGLAHSYQGASGVAATTMLGALLHVLYVGTGSIWVPIVLHILLDLRLLLIVPTRLAGGITGGTTAN